MVNDLELANSLKKLWNKPIYLYGAGVYGKLLLSVFDDFEISTEGFIDRNIELHGKKINGKTVFSFEKVFNIAIEEEIIIIVSTLTYSREVVETLEKSNFSCNNIYTLFGVFWGFYFNLDKIPVKGKVKEKYCQIFKAWLCYKRYAVCCQQAKISFDSLSAFFKTKYNVPIQIMQPGKVGSNTVEATLRQYNVPVIRSHGILYPFAYENTSIPEYFCSRLEDLEKIKIITLVREPISKDIGHFFQKIHISGNDVGWLVKGIMERNFQQSFLNYLSVVTPFDFSGGKKSKYEETIISHIDYIGKINKRGAFWGWFEEELKNNLGVDILKYKFDREKGYTIIKKGNMELLVIKLEYLNKLESVLADFVGLQEVKMKNTNEAGSKSYRYAYDQFKSEVKLPRRYVDFHYSNDYTQHFYSQSEISNFYKKWEKQILD